MPQVLNTFGDGDTRDIAETVRRVLGRATDVGVEPTDSMPGASPVVAELLQALEADSFVSIKARGVTRDGSEWGDAREVEATHTGGRPLLINAGRYRVFVSTNIVQAVQLTEDLDPAESFHDDPSTAMANVLVKNSEGNLEVLQFDGADVQIELVQRFEHLEIIPAHTYGTVQVLNDEWCLDTIDCDAAKGGLL